MASENKGTTQVRWTTIAEGLREAIQRGELQPGDRLPSETQLASEYNVSSMTVHRAMQELQREGWVTRKRKAGTVVAERKAESAPRVALVFGHWGDSLISSYARGVQDALPSEVRLTPYDTRFTLRHEKAHLEQLLAEDSADAVIVSPTGAPENLPLLRELASRHPLIFIDRIPDGFEAFDVPWDAVMTDNTASIRAGLELLHRHGHERIAYFMSDGTPISSISERYEGYRQFMAEHGRTDTSSWVRKARTDLSHVEYGERIEADLKELLSASSPITAICCQQDQTMAAVLEACVHLRVAVPEQLEVLAFCDSDPMLVPLGRSVHRLQQRTFEMGGAAARRLLMRLENPGLPSQVTRFVADLYPASTKGPRPHPEGYLNGQSSFVRPVGGKVTNTLQTI